MSEPSEVWLTRLERLGAGAARWITWVSLMGALATLGLVALWWHGGHGWLAGFTALVGAACVLPGLTLGEALSDVAGLREAMARGLGQVTRQESTRLVRTRDGVFTAVSVSWRLGSAALLSNPLWWAWTGVGLLGCWVLSGWAVIWGLVTLST